jgi:hypothetical protein
MTFAFGFRFGSGDSSGTPTVVTNAGTPPWTGDTSIKQHATVTRGSLTLRNFGGDRTTASTFTVVEAELWDMISQTDILPWTPNKYYYISQTVSINDRNHQRLNAGTSRGSLDSLELAEWTPTDAQETKKTELTNGAVLEANNRYYGHVDSPLTWTVTPPPVVAGGWLEVINTGTGEVEVTGIGKVEQSIGRWDVNSAATSWVRTVPTTAPPVQDIVSWLATWTRQGNAVAVTEVTTNGLKAARLSDPVGNAAWVTTHNIPKTTEQFLRIKYIRRSGTVLATTLVLSDGPPPSALGYSWVVLDTATGAITPNVQNISGTNFVIPEVISTHVTAHTVEHVIKFPAMSAAGHFAIHPVAYSIPGSGHLDILELDLNYAVITSALPTGNGVFQTQVETLVHAATAVEGVSYTHNGTQGTSGGSVSFGNIYIKRRYIGNNQAEVTIQGITTYYGTANDNLVVTLPTGYLTAYHHGELSRNELNVSAHIIVSPGPGPDTIDFNRDDNITGNSTFNWTVSGIGKWVGLAPLAAVVSDGTPPSHLAETITQTAHGFGVQDTVYHTGAAWAKAQADTGTKPAIGIVTSVIDASTFIVTYQGKATIIGHGLTVGEYYWLSQATAGAITATTPTAGYAQSLLHVRDANTVVIDCQQITAVATSTPAILSVANMAAINAMAVSKGSTVQVDDVGGGKFAAFYFPTAGLGNQANRKMVATSQEMSATNFRGSESGDIPGTDVVVHSAVVTAPIGAKKMDITQWANFKCDGQDDQSIQMYIKVKRSSDNVFIFNPGARAIMGLASGQHVSPGVNFREDPLPNSQSRQGQLVFADNDIDITEGTQYEFEVIAAKGNTGQGPTRFKQGLIKVRWLP